MDRRSFLKTTAAAAATATAAGGTAQASALPAAPALSSGVRELRMTTDWPDGVAGLADQAHRLARRLETATGGRLRIVLEPGHAADAAASHDLVVASGHRHLPAHPAFAYFAGLPIAGGIAPAALPAWLQAGGQELWDELAGSLGEKCLLVGHSGAGSRLWSRAPITSADDLAGQPIAAIGLGRDIVRGLAGIPVELPAGGLAAGLADGTVRAAEWCGTMNACALGLASAAAFASPIGLNPNGEAVALSIDRRVWDSMTPGDQTLIEAIAAAELQASLAEAASVERHLADALHARGELHLTALDVELTRAIATLAEAVVADVAGHDALSARIDASYMAFNPWPMASGSRGAWRLS